MKGITVTFEGPASGKNVLEINERVVMRNSDGEVFKLSEKTSREIAGAVRQLVFMCFAASLAKDVA